MKLIVPVCCAGGR